MKVSLLSENLKKGLGIAMRAVSSRAQLPVLSMVHLAANKEGLSLAATDLEISFKVKVRAKVEVKGEMVVPARLLNDLVATLPAGTITLSAEKQTLSVEGEKMSAQIVGQAAAEFPSLPGTTGKGMEIEVEEYAKKMERVAIAAARDETRPVLSGVLWQVEKEKVVLAATDGYRLGLDYLTKVKETKELVEQRFILPVRAVLELARVLEPGMKTVTVEFDREKQQVIFAAGEVEMSSRLIAGEFPPYQKVIPTEKHLTVEVNREDLAEAVRRASLFARDSANVVKLAVAEGELTVTANDDQTGSTRASLTVESEGEGVKAAFNAKYLLDYLGVVTEEKIVWETEGELKPSVFRLTEDRFVYVVMPVRVQGQ